MNLALLPLCLIGKHRRDRLRATLDDIGNARAPCAGCGRPMVKSFEGWVVEQS